MSRALDLGLVERTMRHLLEGDGRPVVLRDEAGGQQFPIPAAVAAAPNGLLPQYLAAAEVVWKEATGRSLGVRQERDPQALLGYRVAAIEGEPFSVVMLSALEAVRRTARPDMLLANDLARLWHELPGRTATASAAPAARQGQGAAP